MYLCMYVYIRKRQQRQWCTGRVALRLRMRWRMSMRQLTRHIKSALRAPPLCQLLIRHTSYVTSRAHAARLLRCRGPRTKPRKHTILTASLAPFTRHLPIHPYSFYYSTLHSCLSSPCPTRASLGAFCPSPWSMPWHRWR